MGEEIRAVPGRAQRMRLNRLGRSSGEKKKKKEPGKARARMEATEIHSLSIRRLAKPG